MAHPLDDPDYPAYTTGRAAEALGVQQAFLRALDAAGVVTPQRSVGNHRRYTRRQLDLARRVRELFDEGHSLASAVRILSLEDDLAIERARVASLHRRLGRQDNPHPESSPANPHPESGPANPHPESSPAKRQPPPAEPG